MNEKHIVLGFELAFVAVICGVILSFRNPDLDGVDPYADVAPKQEMLNEQPNAKLAEHAPVRMGEASF